MNVAVTAPHLPELPRVYVDTTYTTPSGSTVNVTNGTELQTALTNAVGGQIIRVALGNYSGAFTLPNIAGSTYVYVVSANLASLPAPGVRVGLSDAANMPKITSPGSNGSALATAGVVSHHFRFVGIEFTCPSGDTQNGLIRFGVGNETLPSQFPHHLILDRCLIHGDPVTGGVRGVLLAGDYLAVIDSYIYDWKKTDAQCQAVAGWTGQGPWAIKNNYLEADAENFMCGGSDPGITDLVPADIEFINNLCSKPLTWNPFHASFAGTYYNVANLFELKMGRRVLVIENTFTNNWRSIQAGRAILFTTKNQGGYAPWTVIEDVSFLNNVIAGSHSGVAVSGDDGVQPSAGARRIRIMNNFFHDMGGNAWGEDGGNPSSIYALTSGIQYLTIQHNTVIRTPTTPSDTAGLLVNASGGLPYNNFRFLDNVADHNTYGVKGAGLAVGNATVAFYFPACLFEKNVMWDPHGNEANYPANNYFPAAKANVGFRNPASDYRLDPTSTPLGDLSTGLTAFHDLSNANDTVGTNHLTLGVPPAYFPDGAYFTGSAGQYLAIADNAALSTGDIDWTYNIWVNINDKTYSGGFPFIASKGWLMPVDANSEWGLAQNGATGSLVFAVAFGTSSVSVVSSAPTLTSGQLYMVTVWHSATLNQIGICLNAGTADTTSHSGGMNNGNRAFSIGARSDGTLTWDGALAKGTFYKGRVLTAPQITDLYNAGVPLSLATMQAGVLNTCPYYTVASDGGPVGAPDSVIETLP